MNHLISRAQAGDEAAFEALYREHAGRVYALCLRLAGSAAQAQEWTQDVFVRAWEKLRSFRGESAFSSWLHRIAVNVAFQDRRAERRRTNRVFAADDLNVYEAPGAARNPAATMDLEQAIARLPDGARTIFVLHDVEGYRHEEIAEMTGLAVGTSKAQLFRARKLLREALER